VEQIIRDLVELQRLDARIGRLSDFMGRLPELRAALAAERQAAEDKITAERDKLEQAKRALRRKESELKDGEEKARQIQARLNQVKTNKEYEAALKEVEERKRLNGDVESEILVLYDEVEASENERDALEAGWKERAADFDRQRAALDAKAAAAESELGERRQEFDAVVAATAAEILTTYQTLKTKYPRPVARAEREVCTGCNTRIPPQTYNLVLKADKAIQCPSCWRMLVHPDCHIGDGDEEY
jgi:uncharacterized protein